MKERLLQVKNLCYTYECETPALCRMDVEFYAGERVAVIGSNGSGKSTFFLSLNGVLNPDSGEIWYRGIKVEKKDKKLLRQKIGLVFQDADQQLIAPTVEMEISFGPMNLKLDKAETGRRTTHAMEVMKLTELAARAPHYLSGGEKKRVSIADIIAMESEIILFDEPNTALDPQSQQMLESVLGQLAKEGKTLIVSTHDMDFAYRFADRILVLDTGKLIADGLPEEIFLNEALLAKTGLKPPVMLEIAKILEKNGLLAAGEPLPRTPEEMNQQIQRKREDNFV